MSKRKAPEDNSNKPITDFLIGKFALFNRCSVSWNGFSNVYHRVSVFGVELADYEKNVNRSFHKSNAYRKAASSIAQHKEKLNKGSEAKKLVRLNFIL